MTHHDDLFYDFDHDAWVTEPAFVHSQWSELALPKPETSPAPGRWHRTPARVPLRGRGLGRLLAALGVVLALPVIALSGAALGYLASVSVPIPFVGVLVAFGIWGALGAALLHAYSDQRDAEGLPADRDDMRLLEDLEDPDVCLVEIAIVDRRGVVGVDRGVVWFEKGRLLFSGHRTSFAVGGEDVLPVHEWPARLGTWPFDALPDDALPLRHDTKAVSVRFVPLRHAHEWAERATRFRERLLAFRRRPPQSRGPRQWPPFDANA